MYLLTNLLGAAVFYFVAWLVGLVIPAARVPVLILGCGWWLWIGWKYAKARDLTKAPVASPTPIPVQPVPQVEAPPVESPHAKAASELGERVNKYKGSAFSIMWVPLVSMYMGKHIKDIDAEPMGQWTKDKLMDADDVPDPTKQNGYELKQDTVLFDYPWMTSFFTYEEHVYEIKFQINCRTKEFGDELYAAAKAEITSVLAEGLELLNTLHMWQGTDGTVSLSASHVPDMSTLFITASYKLK